MATILLTWELGSGLGHILPLRAVGQALVNRGHRVLLALRDTAQAEASFTGTGITPIQAPRLARKGARPFPQIRGFAHMLANSGFADESQIAQQFAAWNDLFDSVRPDLVVTDHSPTALLALRGRSVRVASLGLAFYTPPDVFPLPHWARRGHLPGSLQIGEDERPLTQTANRLLQSKNRPKLERLGQMFNELDEVMIATYKEFDPFGVRKGTRYWGHWHAGGGIAPAWPQGTGPKIYAYLKPFPGIDALLSALRDTGSPCIIYAGAMADLWEVTHSAPALVFKRNPLDITQVAQECDLAITHAGHGTMASILMAGKPLLLFPLYVEQVMNAQAVARMGAGHWLAPRDSRAIGPALRMMLSTDRFGAAAQAFAARYRGVQPGQQLPEIVERLETLAKSR